MTETVELKPDSDSTRILRQFADMYRSGAQGCQMDFEAAQAVALSIDDILSTRSDPAVRDRVKPLEWKDGHGVKWPPGVNSSALIRCASGLGVHYTIHEYKLGGFALLITEAFRSVMDGRKLSFDSEAEAKSAAQADYERRIISALEPRTSPPEPASGWKWELVPDYPAGDVVGACICGSWPGGECLKCPPAKEPQ